jgi:DNA replication protein DnaC
MTHLAIASMDQLVEYALVNPTKASRSRCQQLSMTLPPSLYNRSSKERSIAKIPSALRSAIAEMVDGKKPWPLTLVGDVGTGKTCASLALSDHVYGSLYDTFRGLCDIIRTAEAGRMDWYSEGRGGKIQTHQVWKGYRQAPLTILDEIGSREKVSDFQYDCLYDMLEVREYRPLILISNLRLGDLAKTFDERITSRMIAGTVVEVNGDDMRDPRVKR